MSDSSNSKTTTRISIGTMAGLTVQTSRVRTCIDALGLNKRETDLLSALESEGGLESLSPADAAFVETCVADYSSEVSKTPTTAVSESWASATPLVKARLALSERKYRISPGAIVALASVVDQLTHEFSVHVIQNTLEANRVDVKNDFFMSGVEKLSLYPLVSSLKTFEEEKATPGATADALRRHKNKDKTQTGVVAEGSTESDDDDDGLPDFSFYVGNVLGSHIFVEAVTDESGETKTRQTSRSSEEFRVFVSNMILEFISSRVTNFIRVILRVRNAKTVSDDLVLAALELMMVDAHASGEQLLTGVRACLLEYETNLAALKSATDKARVRQSLKEVAADRASKVEKVKPGPAKPKAKLRRKKSVDALPAETTTTAADLGGASSEPEQSQKQKPKRKRTKSESAPASETATPAASTAPAALPVVESGNAEPVVKAEPVEDVAESKSEASKDKKDKKSKKGKKQ